MSQVSALSLQERLREEARLIQYGGRACVPGLLHEAAAEIDRLTRELESAAVRLAKEPAGFGDAR